MAIQRLGIWGANDLAGDLALVFASRGLHVLLIDSTKEVLESCVNRIRGRVSDLVEEKKLTGHQEESLFSRIQLSLDKKALRRTDYVIETENDIYDNKHKILIELDEILDPEVIIASTSRHIPISRLIHGVKHVDRFIGLNFIDRIIDNRSLEIITGYKTSGKVFEETCELFNRVEYKWIRVLDSAGFVFNRLLVSLINEAAYLLFEQVSSKEDIDQSFTTGFSKNMGPLKLADEIGLDYILMTLEHLYKEYKQDKYIPCPLIKRYVDSGFLGKKTGRGFFEYKIET